MDVGSLLMALYQKPLAGMSGTPQLVDQLQAPNMPWNANQNVSPGGSPYQPLPPSDYSRVAMLRNALNQHLDTTGALRSGLSNLTNTTDPALAAALRQQLETSSAAAQSIRDQLRGMGPRPAPTGPLARPPMMAMPQVATRPGSGGLIGQEEGMERQREGLEPPND